MAKSTKKIDEVGPTEESLNELEDNILEQVRLEYGNEQDIRVKLYRKGAYNKKSFITEYDYLPTEVDIKNAFGGGDYTLFIYQDKQLLKAPTIYIEGRPKALEEIEMQQTTEPIDDDDDLKMLKRLQLYKEVLNGGNNGSEMKSIVDLIIQSNKQQTDMLVEMIKSNAKPKEDNSFIQKILETLLTTSLNKTDSLSEVERLAKIKDILTGGSSDGEGGGMMSQIAQFLPLLAPLLAGQGNNQQTPPMPIPQQQTPQRPQIKKPTMSMEDIEKRVREVARDETKKTIDEELPLEEELEELDELEYTDEQAQTFNPNLSFVNLNEEQMLFNLEKIIEKINGATREEQNNALSQALKLTTSVNVFKWCFNNGLIDSVDNFIERCKEINYDLENDRTELETLQATLSNGVVSSQ